MIAAVNTLCMILALLTLLVSSHAVSGMFHVFVFLLFFLMLLPQLEIAFLSGAQGTFLCSEIIPFHLYVLWAVAPGLLRLYRVFWNKPACYLAHLAQYFFHHYDYLLT